MSVSPLPIPLRALIAALVAWSVASTNAHANDCQQAFRAARDDAAATHRWQVAGCRDAACVRRANEEKAGRNAVTNRTLRECVRLERASDQTQQQPPYRAGSPGTWSDQGDRAVWTDEAGVPWLFKPRFDDNEGRLYELDRNSVNKWTHAGNGKTIISAYYRYRNPMVPGHEDHVQLDGVRAPGF